MALYGCLLWSLSSKSIHLIKVAFNKILRKVLNLACHSHTNIVHSVAYLPSISDIVFKRFSTYFNCDVVSTSCVISRILSQSSLLAYTFTGYNFMYGSHNFKNYSDLDYFYVYVQFVEPLVHSPHAFENLIVHLSCL